MPGSLFQGLFSRDVVVFVVVVVCGFMIVGQWNGTEQYSAVSTYIRLTKTVILQFILL